MKKTFILGIFCIIGAIFLCAKEDFYAIKGGLSLRMYLVNNKIKYVFINNSDVVIKLYGISNKMNDVKHFYLYMVTKDSLGKNLGTFCPRILYKWYNIDNKNGSSIQIQSKDSTIGTYTIRPCDLSLLDTNKFYDFYVEYSFPLPSPGPHYFLADSALNNSRDSLFKQEITKYNYWIGDITSNIIRISGKKLREIEN